MALFSSEKAIREIASAILIEIGPPAIPVILEKQLWKIPGKQHGYDTAKDIFIAMGARAVETLVNNIDKDVAWLLTSRERHFARKFWLPRGQISNPSPETPR